jgi:hypothetical protein
MLLKPLRPKLNSNDESGALKVLDENSGIIEASRWALVKAALIKSAARKQEQATQLITKALSMDDDVAVWYGAVDGANHGTKLYKDRLSKQAKRLTTEGYLAQYFFPTHRPQLCAAEAPAYESAEAKTQNFSPIF